MFNTFFNQTYNQHGPFKVTIKQLDRQGLFKVIIKQLYQQGLFKLTI